MNRTKHDNAIKKLNRELLIERRSKRIILNAFTLFACITFVGPFFLLIVMDTDAVYDAIDGVFSSWRVQLYFLITLLLFTSYLYIRWRFLR